MQEPLAVETVSISKAELATLQNTASFLREGLWNDKDIGLAVKKKAKERFKDINIPELEVEERMEAADKARKEELESIRKDNLTTKEEFEAFKKKQQDEKDNLTFMEQYEKVRKDYSFTEDGMQKVMARMKDKNNPDIESAAAWVARQEPSKPVTSSNYMPSEFNAKGFFAPDSAEEAWKGFEDPNTRRAAENDIINQVLSTPEKFREFGGLM